MSLSRLEKEDGISEPEDKVDIIEKTINKLKKI
jgi:hypothetical protein